MTEQDIQKLVQELDQVRSHVLIFETHLPDIIKGARTHAKAHLLVFKDSFPRLRHTVEFAEQVVPTINRMIRIWPEKAGSIPQATSNLRKVTEATEMATTEIMDVVDGITEQIEELKARLQAQRDSLGEGIKSVDEKRQKVEACLGDGKGPKAQVLKEVVQWQQSLESTLGEWGRTLDEVVQGLEGINDSLFQILNALQFQDITTQQIEATKAILAELNEDLKSLFKNFTEIEVEGKVEVRHGTFDRQAHYDREEAKRKQKMIDQVFEKTDEVGGGGKEEGEKIEQEGVVEGKTSGEVVSQDDIDAIFG